ncbi:astacin-like metalloprotease toxin 1 [Caerostris darwini]|uniref:Metalloendopeptidase n=1 Tax=Caerostris darwini TaxID=1538125 RepID=A0AAV4S102_9ARAC|nr:astacin-like metalloprotease toxin 1 [Caerostris darwini]
MGNCPAPSIEENEDDEVMRDEGSGWQSSNRESSKSKYRQNKHVAVRPDQLWPDGIVPYKMDHALDYNQSTIKRAMKTIEKYSRIRFIERTHEDPFLKITQANGCFFSKGNIDRPRLSLGIGCESFGTVLHELLHAIGFHHEHKRPDRDNYVRIHWNNIQKGNESQFWKLKEYEYIWSDFPFDYESIMLYDSYAFSKNGRKTIEPIDGGNIPRYDKLSEMDKEKLSLL